MIVDSTQAPDPFGEFETAAEIVGFVYKKFGADGLRQLLAMDAEDELTCEFLERAADELAEVGLAKAAAIVAEVASESPSEIDCCPYEPDSANGKSWLAGRTRRRLQQRQT